MSRVDSNYARKERDEYNTPDWVCAELVRAIPRLDPCKIWEPACGVGNLVRALADAGHSVYATDIVDGENFHEMNDSEGSDGIVTNPPYTDCAAFIQHAIDVMMPRHGFVVMLQAIDFDSAKSRRDLFADCPIFAMKIALLKRIVWFERDDGKPAAPSENHAIYIWDWHHLGTPSYGWAP